jgi:hypothetical protein
MKKDHTTGAIQLSSKRLSVYAVSTLEIAKLQISAQIRKLNPNFLFPS